MLEKNGAGWEKNNKSFVVEGTGMELSPTKWKRMLWKENGQVLQVKFFGEKEMKKDKIQKGGRRWDQIVGKVETRQKRDEAGQKHK